MPHFPLTKSCGFTLDKTNVNEASEDEPPPPCPELREAAKIRRNLFFLYESHFQLAKLRSAMSEVIKLGVRVLDKSNEPATSLRQRLNLVTHEPPHLWPELLPAGTIHPSA